MTTRKEDHKIHDFREALRIFRLKAGLTQQELASKLGIDKQMVKDWELGKVAPSLLCLKLLYDVLQDLRYVTEYLPKMIRDQLWTRAHLAGKDGKELWFPPSATPSDLPVPGDLLKLTFGQVLSVAMREESVTVVDLQTVLDVRNLSDIELWTSNSKYPTEEQYKALLDLFPQLDDAPRPGEIDKTLPPVVSLLSEPYVASSPIILPPPVVKPEPKTSPSHTPKRIHSKTAQAGIEHANSLLALQHARLYMDELKAQISQLENEISILEEGVKLSERNLLETVRQTAEEELLAK
jgi:DNA-binding XRE family transcriptional regulator